MLVEQPLPQTSSSGCQIVDAVPLLDFLRTFAAWAVLAWHLADHLRFEGLPIFSSGAFAVDIFMNVSGFLMFYHYARREHKEPWERPKTWKTFWVRRFFRIAPLYYVLMLMTLVWRDFLHLNAFDGKAVFLHLSFLFGFIKEQVSNSAFPDWSLALEMQFYLLFPFLAMALRKMGPGCFFATMSIIAAVSRLLITYYSDAPAGLLGQWPQPSLLPLKIQIFTIGMIIAEVYLRGPQVLRSKWFLLGFVAFALTCSHNYMRLMGVLYLAAYLCCLRQVTSIWLYKYIGRLNQWCGKGWFHFPAELSYSCYLLHGILMAVFFRYVPCQGGGDGVSGWQFLVWFFGAIVIVNAASAVTYLLIEKPGIKIGRSLARC